MLPPDLRWGLRWGFRYSCIYFVVALVIAVGEVAGEAVGSFLRLAGVLLLYFPVGLAGGLVVGWLRPFTRSVLGSGLVGLAAGWPVSFGLMLMIAGLPTTWTGDEFKTVAFLALVVGPLAGMILRWRLRRD
jgi:hypothetical protein